jgi:hypothetical protein
MSARSTGGAGWGQRSGSFGVAAARWAFVVAASWWFHGGAWAQTYYLESEPSSSRTSALEVARAAADVGVTGRLVRLYVPEKGWVYLFRSEDASGDDELRRQRSVIATSSGQAVHLVEAENGETRIVDQEDGEPRPVASSAGAAPSVAPPPVSVDRALDVQEILRRVVRAHAGPAPGEGLAAVPALVFRFERSLPGGKVEHLYARRGDDLFLQIDAKDGAGVPVRLGVVKGKAWVTDAPGAAGAAPPDAVRAREQIERFSPVRVLGVPLLFTGGLPGGREYELLTVGDGVKIHGRPAVVLTWAGDRASAALQVMVDTGTWRILEVARGVDEGRLRWVFSDYVELDDGRIHPGRIEVLQADKVIDRILVRQLELDPTLLDEWFLVPSP